MAREGTNGQQRIMAVQALAYFGKRNRNAYFLGFDFELAEHDHYW
jgi:hypothetical protein